jgi:Mg-chelatase subunit ChlD
MNFLQTGLVISQLQSKSGKRRGGTLVLILLMLPALIILGGFAINWAQMQLVQTEMQIATDTAARAANRVYVMTGRLDLALEAAQGIADKNLVANQPLKLSANDFSLGTSVRSQAEKRYEFTPNLENANALRLKIHKSDSSPSGPVKLLFPMYKGIDSVDLMREAISTQLELDIALVIDRSGSMAYAANEKAAFPPNPKSAGKGWAFGHSVPNNSRWLDTIKAVEVFLQELKNSPHNEQVSLATYADSSKTDTALTSDYGSIVAALTPYSKSFKSGGTNIGDGLKAGVNTLAKGKNVRPWATKVVILMTDGIFNEGPKPTTVAEAAAKQGIMIFTVTFSDEANKKEMLSVAEIGGGKHFHAKTADDLVLVFQEMGKMMPTLLSY